MMQERAHIIEHNLFRKHVQDNDATSIRGHLSRISNPPACGRITNWDDKLNFNVDFGSEKCRYHAKFMKISTGVHVRNANMQNGRLNRSLLS